MTRICVSLGGRRRLSWLAVALRACIKFAGPDQVDVIRAGGPTPRHGSGKDSLDNLVKEMMKRKQIGYVQVRKGPMSLTLRGSTIGNECSAA